MKPTNVMEANVNRGFAVMAAERPGFHNRIDLQMLDMSSGSNCTLGQEFGSYTRGLQKLRLRTAAAEYGFCTGTSGSYKQLTTLWRRKIQTRRLEDILYGSIPVDAEDLVAV